jgi:SH3-like domain-containing protein
MRISKKIVSGVMAVILTSTTFAGVVTVPSTQVGSATSGSIVTNIGADACIYSTPTVYNQNDYGNVAYGYQNSACTVKATLKTSGCGVLAYVNLIKNITGTDVQPSTIATYSLNNGYRVNGVGTAYGLYKAFANAYGSSYGIKYATNTSSWDTLSSYLNSGSGAIIHVPGHIMALVGYDSSSGKYLLVDSNPSSKRGTSSGYRWATKSELQSMGVSSDFYIISPTKVSNSGTSSSSSSGSSSTTSASGVKQINTSSSPLNMRSSASTSSSVITTIPKGAYVSVLGTSGSFTKVSYKGKTGYCSTNYLKSISATKKTVATSSSPLNMRSSASTSGSVVTTLAKGTTVYVTATSGNWYYCVSSTGYSGWCSSTYIK